MKYSGGEPEPDLIVGIPGVIKNILVGTATSLRGPILVFFTAAGTIVGWKLWLQEIIIESWKIYLPDSVFFLCLFGLAVSLSTLRLIRTRKSDETKHYQNLVLPKGSKLRVFAWVLLLGVVITCAIGSILCWKAHYRPAKFKEDIVILIDQFRIGGWEDSDFFTPIKDSLEKEIAVALPNVKTLVDSLKPPIGIVDAEARLDWARRSGARLVIFATGSRDKIQPHIYVCVDSVPQLDVFSDLDMDMKVDLPTASYRSQVNPRYQFLPPEDRHRLCIVEELTPQRVAYLVDLAMGLIYLYNRSLATDHIVGLKAADQFFQRAVNLDNDRTCDLDYCEALYYSGYTKLKLATSLPAGNERNDYMYDADSIFQTLLMMNPDHRDAIFCLGNLNVLKGEFGEAAKCFDRFGELPGADSSVYESLIIAVAMNNYAQALAVDGKHEEALKAYAGILFQIEGSSYPFLRLQAVQVLNNKAYSLSKMGRLEEALNTYLEIYRRESSSIAMDLQSEAANALVNSAITLEALKKSTEATAMYEDVIARFGTSENTRIQAQVVRAAANLGALLGLERKYSQALDVLDLAISRFELSEDPEVQMRVTMAWFNKTGVLRQASRTDDALSELEKLIDYCKDRPSSGLDESMARAIYNKGAIYTRLEDTTAAMRYYDLTIERFLFSTNSNAKIYAIRSLINKGGILQATGLPYEAIACFNLAAELSDAFPGPMFEEQYVAAMANKGVTLLSQGLWKESIRTNNELIRRFGQSLLPYAHRKVGEAMLNKAAAFLNLGKTDSASVALCATLKYCDKALSDIRDSVLALQQRNENLTAECD